MTVLILFPGISLLQSHLQLLVCLCVSLAGIPPARFLQITFSAVQAPLATVLNGSLCFLIAYLADTPVSQYSIPPGTISSINLLLFFRIPRSEVFSFQLLFFFRILPS